MQVIFQATTSTTVAYGTAITTGNVQVLPAWAPPIQYIGTTTPWMVIALGVTTGADGGITGGSAHARFLHVRGYGRRSTLQSGAEVVTLRTKVETTATKKPVLTVTYRAIGEIVRP